MSMCATFASRTESHFKFTVGFRTLIEAVRKRVVLFGRILSGRKSLTLLQVFASADAKLASLLFGLQSAAAADVCPYYRVCVSVSHMTVGHDGAIVA